MSNANPCPGDNTLAVLAAGQPASPRLLEHLARCVACQELVAAGLRDSADEAPRYEIGQLLGVGGMGVVVRATDTVLQRPVALKILWGTRGRRVGALLREARMLARVSHPNIVTIHDAGVLPQLDVPFIAMELVEGPSLRTWLTQTRSWRDVLAVFVAAAQGLANAHEQGVVHADFKPANVLIANGGRRVLVSDFGLARTPQPVLREATHTGWGGTPRYVAPEQRDGPPGTAADQYAFGVALHEALWGRHPHLDASSPAASQGRVPARLRRIVARCIAQDPGRRYPSMAVVVDELRAVMRSRRSMITLAALATSIAVTLAGVAVGRDDPCAAAARGHAGAWSGSIRPALTGAMEPEVWARVSRATDQWVQRWLERSEASCRADEPAPVQGCLLEQWSVLTFLHERASADPQAVALALSQLPPIDACASTASKTVPARVTAEQLQGCAQVVARGRTLVMLGDNAGAQPVLSRAIATCEDSGLDGLAARAYHARGVARWNLREVDAAFEDLFSASESALRSGHFDVSAEALALSAQYVAAHRHDFELARQRLSMARAQAQRIDQPGLDLTLDRQEAWIFFLEGRDADASSLMRAMMQREGLSQWQQATYAWDLGTFLTRTDDVDGALAALQKAIELGTALFGPEHTSVTGATFNKAILLMRFQQWDEAISLLERAEASYAASTGPRSELVLYTMLNRVDALCDAGRLDEAEVALEVLRRALSNELVGKPELANTVRQMLAHLKLEQGQFATARVQLLDLVATWVNPGPSPGTLAALHRDLGFAELGLDNHAQAHRWFARALDNAHELDPWSLGAIQLGTAQAMRAGGSCTPEVRAAANEAIATWTAHGTPPATSRASQARAWLDTCVR